jgi:hypothetical protein
LRDAYKSRQATIEALAALTDQPDPIFVPCEPLPEETDRDFAERLRTVLMALITAVDEYRLEGPIRAWVGRVRDWEGVDWADLAGALTRKASASREGCDRRTCEEPRAAA